MYEDDVEIGEKKSNIEMFFSYIWLWGPFLFMLIMQNRMGTVGPFDKAVATGWGVMLFVMLVKLSYTWMYNASPKLVWTTGHATFSGKLETVGNMAIFTNGFKAFSWYYDYKSPVYVVPIDAITKIGECGILNCDMEIVDIEEMPPEVRGHIYEHDLRPPFRLGYASPEQMMQTAEGDYGGIESPSVSGLIILLKEKDRFINMILDVAKGKYGAVEDIMAGLARIKSRGDENLMKKLMDGITKGEEK